MSSPPPGRAHLSFADGDEAVREHLLTVDVGEADGDVKFWIRNPAEKSDTTGAAILNWLTLDIPKGVIMGVIGPSGSGKSTLLRALNRLWEPPSGTVFLDGRDILDVDVLSLRRKVGMLFQLPALFEVSQFMHARTMAHMQIVKRTLRYLKGSVGKGILMKKNDNTSIMGYTDADWAGNSLDRKSTTGFCTFVGGNLVTWRNKKQKVS